MKRSCIEWCTENGIEYIEACALDVDLDKSMIPKSDNKISRPTLPDKEAEPREDTYGGWVSANGTIANVSENNSIKECENENREKFGIEEIRPSSSAMELLSDKRVVPNVQEPREN
ncbi:hypothetical protein NC652_019113 [Populus alba x Populus x berolinensis]|nr:hypothetical protein NC652_019113 [Populus alba x Populus x berolinensis]KAJ6990539.1 hypothetical protein NC653_018947 [Populus alba x Populus x berolinensis]